MKQEALYQNKSPTASLPSKIVLPSIITWGRGVVPGPLIQCRRPREPYWPMSAPRVCTKMTVSSENHP